MKDNQSAHRGRKESSETPEKVSILSLKRIEHKLARQHASLRERMAQASA